VPVRESERALLLLAEFHESPSVFQKDSELKMQNEKFKKRMVRAERLFHF
jgi:hypothetical protein